MRYANDTLTGTLLPDCASVSLLHSARTLLSTPRALLAARSRVRLRVIPSLCVESTLLVARLRISPRSAGSDFALHSRHAYVSSQPPHCVGSAYAILAAR